MTKQNDDLEIKPGEDYALRVQTPKEKADKAEYEDTPEYRIDLDLDDEQQKRLTEQAFLEFEAHKTQREERGLEDRWKEMDNLYDGVMAVNKNLPFTLHVPQAKIKTNAVVRALSEALLDSDPICDISPRPEMARQDGWEVATKQTEFIDYAMDEEIKPANNLIRIGKSSFKKFVGIGKVCWAYRRQKRRREETYEGKNELVAMGGNGNPVLTNEGLEQFMKTYPEALEKHKSLIRRLADEKKISIVVEYKDQVKNSPELKMVKVEDFYVDVDTEQSYDGLCQAHSMEEREEYTYWELKAKEQKGEFKNVDQLFDITEESKQNPGQSKDYMTAKYKVLCVTIMFKLDEDDEDEVKLKCYFGEEKKIYLGAELFPYYGFDSDYIPFYVELNEDGFYGGCKSAMSNLRDSNIAQDALLSLALSGTYRRNILTPIVREGSEVETLFLERRWTDGMPLPVDDLSQDINKDINFVQWPQLNLNDLVLLGQVLQRQDGDVTGVNDAAASGRNDPTDPRAPASKTIALLQQSGINIKDYIRTFLPSFEIFLSCVLQLYYQMSQESGRQYKLKKRIGEVTGQEPFKKIGRDEMVAKTNVQARASAFVFDKANEKVEAMTALNIVQSNPYTARIPKVQYKAVKNALELLGPKWKNMSDKDLPSPDEFEKEQMQVAVKAIQQLLAQKQQVAQTTGVPPKLDPQEAAAAVTEAQAVNYNPAMAPEAK